SAFTRIIGGINADLKDVPYQLALKIEDNNRKITCGAVLISRTYALTAAHCLHGNGENAKYVLKAGSSGFYREDPHTQKRTPDKLWTHKGFLSGKFIFDIAALHVRNPFEVNDFVRPILLPSQNYSLEGFAVVSGWGCTDRDCEGRMSSVLKRAAVPIVPQNICMEAYPYSIYPSMFCAGFVEGGSKDACRGDSGGPLVVEDGAHRLLIGLVSWGNSCACPGYPGVYTRITAYLTWIQDVMGGIERSNVQFGSTGIIPVLCQYVLYSQSFVMLCMFYRNQ
ncbi:unnamed protein product, partial [Allacma fusca]